MIITRNFAYTIYNLIRKLFINRYEQQDRDEAMKRRDELNGWRK
jgi:5-methylthioribose kinase